MSKLTEDYKDFLMESLADPEEAILYLIAAFEQDDLSVITLSLQDVKDAVALKYAKRNAESPSSTKQQKKISVIKPIDPAALAAFEQAWQFYVSGNLPAAVKEFRQTMAMTPHCLGLLNNRLMEEFREKQIWERAIAGLRFILMLDPNYEMGRNNLAMLYLNKGVAEGKRNIGQALYLHYVALGISPTDNIVKLAKNNLSVLYTLLGEKAYQQDKHEETVQNMSMAYAFMPDEYTRKHLGLAFAALANHLLQAGNPQEAIEHFEHAEEMGLLWSDLINDHGVALASAGRFNEAAIKFEQSLQIDPNSDITKLNLERANNATKEDANVNEKNEKAFNQAMSVPKFDPSLSQIINNLQSADTACA